MIKTYGVQYLGSKTKIVDYITSIMKREKVSTAIDVFTGTTRVAQALKKTGIQVVTSDLAEASSIYSSAFIGQSSTSHLQPHIDKMNNLEGYKGWISENYSGGDDYKSPKGDGRYIYPPNSYKADAARDYIETLDLSKLDKDTLICSVIFAINQVNNSVGQQQAYLKEWCDRSQKDIVFSLPPLIEGPTGTHIQGDCLDITYPKADIAYLDPPYTHTVAYHTYYHIWDSIALWDKPQTKGKAKRRIDRVKRGDNWREQYNNTFTNIPWYDIKNQDNIELNKAYQAFETIVKKLNTKQILISYSNESIVSKDQLMGLLSKYGTCELFEIDHKRMVMGSIGHSSKGKVISKGNPNVTEYLFLLTKKITY